MIKKFLQWLQIRVFSSFCISIYSIITSFSLAYVIYTGFFQRHFFSWRYLLLCILFFVIFTLITGWINTNFLFKNIAQLNKSRKVFLLIFSCLLAIILLVNSPIQPVYYLLPDSEMEISFTIGDDAQAAKGVQLKSINTGQGYVHHSNMTISGEYEVADTTLVFHPGQKVDIHWKGKAGAESRIIFQSTLYDQPVSITWNGQTSSLNLMRGGDTDVTFAVKTPIPLQIQAFSILTFLLASFYLIMLLIIALAHWNLKTGKTPGKRSWSWVWYMLPMLLVWIFSLLVFWPGVFTNDSYALWRQAVDGNFNDWQSAFFAIVLYLLIRIHYSLSFILILQILFFAAVTAYGLGRFEKLGVPKAILWIISILFAISPLNNMQAITLWKDIPYSIAFLWLTILTFEILDSDGEWIGQKSHLILIFLVSLLISLLRQNGMPAAAGTFLILALIYKNRRKEFLILLVSLVAMFGLIKIPLYNLIGIDRKESGQSNLILVHHIAAHLDADTDFEPDELQYLNSLLPLADWDYDCCYMGTIYLNNDFDKYKLISNSAYNQKLAFNLFLRDPAVDFRHMLCAGEPSWKYGQNQCKIFSTHGFNKWSTGKQDWIIPNEFSLKEASVFPELIQVYANVLRNFGFLDDNLVPYLRPAFYFYLFLLSLAIAYMRNDNWRIFIVGIPIILQTLLLLLINFSPVLRYFYSTNLVGTLFILIIFYRKRKAETTEAL
jgi:hypothetical protein